MGKLQEFEITFTNNKVVYNPGESISGTVRIKTSHSLQFKVFLCSIILCIGMMFLSVECVTDDTTVVWDEVM
ncbi:hypothetical protein DPX16_13183 [Anabarilius grahami]|uniref:Arrestin-like N-terminal domain-containing protein n=1 Tax=Anabarilius grahami TaxID=495550 RepID=A0A3N0YP17_ANAGA|nr:hypothetical protein DPX16_13183 [Anabarilius grahami]